MNLPEAPLEFWRNLDRRAKLWCSCGLIMLLACAVGWSLLAAGVSAIERKRSAREAVLRELLPLKVKYQASKIVSDQMAGRMTMLRPDDTPARIMDDIGIKGKGIKVVPVKGEERAGAVEDAAEIRIDGVTVNEAINLLYRLEKGMRPVLIKKGNLKMRFDDPSRCDLVLIIALLRPAPGVSK